jgi:hypothetical protein
MTILSQNEHSPDTVKGGGGFDEPSHGEPGRPPLQRHHGTPAVSPEAAFDALPQAGGHAPRAPIAIHLRHLTPVDCPSAGTVRPASGPGPNARRRTRM